MNNMNLVNEIISKFTDLSIKTIIDSLTLCIRKGRKEIFMTLYHLLGPNVEIPNSSRS